MRQSLQLSGLGTMTFKKAADAVQEIYGLFGRKISSGNLESLSAETMDLRGEHVTLGASNRYLMPKKDAGNMKSIRIPQYMDSDGCLATVTAGGLYIYGE